MSDIPPDGTRLAALARAYDGDATRRDAAELEWRRDLIDGWSDSLRPAARIIELGAGTGQASEHLATRGFEMLALDLSAGNVAMCHQRGLTAVVGDMGRIEDIADPAFDPPYDAAFAINALIHFPKAQLDVALGSIRAALVPELRLTGSAACGSDSQHQQCGAAAEHRFPSLHRGPV